MAIIYKVLGQAVTSGSFVGNTLYTAPVGGTAVSSTLSVCNLNSADSSYSIAVVPVGQTIGAKHSIASNSVIKGNETIALSMGITLGSNDSIIVNSINSNLSFNLFGSQSMITDVLVNYLVVGGGGGGAGGSGGGGGAGGFLENSSVLRLGTGYGITVGSGGLAGTVNNIGGVGGSSNINLGSSSITASGGGYGASGWSERVMVGGNGGSGGGGGYYGDGTFGSTAGGTGIVGQGKNGGAGDPALAFAGGGGGAGAAGSGGAGSTGAGGIGLSSSITGTATYYAGGGSGWPRNIASVAGGLGGGGASSSAGTGSPGVANTGGGGGGGQYSPSIGAGGAGGSGIVILKVPNKYTAAFSGGLTSSLSTTVDYGVVPYGGGYGAWKCTDDGLGNAYLMFLQPSGSSVILAALYVGATVTFDFGGQDHTTTIAGALGPVPNDPWIGSYPTSVGFRLTDNFGITGQPDYNVGHILATTGYNIYSVTAGTGTVSISYNQ